MPLLNYVIKASAEAGLSETLYSIINSIAPMLVIPFYFINCKKYKIGLIRGFFAAVIFERYIVYCASGVLWVEYWITSFTGGNVVAGFPFLVFGPLLLALIFRLPWRSTSDMLAPMPFILHGTYRIACMFAGCCYGYESKWGIYNPYLDRIDIPVQLIEMLISYGIVVFFMIRGKKRKYIADGKLLPMGMIIYGSGRFITEFLHEDVKRIFGFSATSFYALFMIIIGVVSLLIIGYINKKKGVTAEVTPTYKGAQLCK